MTWLEFLNRFILQWFFIRLFRVADTERPNEQNLRLGGWIEPLSGWDDDYKWHGRFMFGKKIA